MVERKFKVGDIVRCTEEGRVKHAAGHQYDRLVVTHCLEDDFDGSREPTIRVRAEGQGYPMGRWREKWYEPEGGPW